MILDLSAYLGVSLLIMRLAVASVFITSGWGQLTQTEKRVQSLGLPTSIVLLVGIAEILGAVSLAFGIYSQIGAFLLTAIMIGAIYKKIVAWQIGYFKDHTGGWHYDFLLLSMNLVILTTAGGRLVLI